MRIGVLGGNYFWSSWNIPHSVLSVSTPYGDPADLICHGIVGDHEVFTLQRHGATHQLAPNDVPWRANVYALSAQCLDFVVHVAVCGALNQKYRVGDLVLIDQIIDFTRQRPITMGPPTITRVTHTDCAYPFDPLLRQAAHGIFTEARCLHHCEGTIVTIEGPRFSTVAESRMFRTLGGDLINMTTATEALLFAELGMPVIGMVLVTDNDTATVINQSVTAEQITKNIVSFGNVVPNALLLFLTKMGNIAVKSRQVRPFDVHELQLRGNTRVNEKDSSSS